MRRLNKQGFTIIELLIATVVFSVVLLIVTTGIVQFGRVYYKGVIQSRTQERARAIVEDISQNLEFSSSPVTGLRDPINGGYYCVGSTRYTFRYNVQQISGQQVLIADNGGCTATFTSAPSWAWPAGRELTGENMQLLDLNITQIGTSGLWTITVRLAYGSSSDMSSTTPKTCNAIRLGGQFCATSQLTTTVTRRLK